MKLPRRVGRLTGRSSSPPARTPLTERGRFDVAVMAILKDEAPNMEEWLCHHLAIGVDHFFLYDNGSTDELHEVLKPYADHGIVTTVYFPLRGLQRDANNHVVRFFGSTTEWIAYVDIDEFLVPEHDEDIGTVMRRYPDAQQVLVSRREFCYAGNRTPVEGLVTENYREYSDDVPRMGSSDILAKPIIRPAGTFRVGIHYAVTVDGRTVNTAGEPIREDANNIVKPSYANLQMNHYYTKSWEEFQAKRTRATTSTHAFQLPDVPFDIASSPDHAIDRWLPRTKAMIDEMRALDREPSRYGSRLRMSGFPIADQFAQEVIAVVSNEAAGLAEPRRKHAFKPLPLPGIRGGLVRADDRGYEPAPGRLLGSAHVAQQIAWLRAETSWDINAPDAAVRVEGGTAVTSETAADGPPSFHLHRPGAAVIIPAGGRARRLHALVFSIAVEGAARVDLDAHEADGWEEVGSFDLPAAGTFLGFMALEKRPRTLDSVRLRFDAPGELVFYDLALLTFG